MTIHKKTTKTLPTHTKILQYIVFTRDTLKYKGTEILKKTESGKKISLAIRTKRSWNDLGKVRQNRSKPKASLEIESQDVTASMHQKYIRILNLYSLNTHKYIKQV